MIKPKLYTISLDKDNKETWEKIYQEVTVFGTALVKIDYSSRRLDTTTYGRSPVDTIKKKLK